MCVYVYIIIRKKGKYVCTYVNDTDGWEQAQHTFHSLSPELLSWAVMFPQLGSISSSAVPASVLLTCSESPQVYLIFFFFSDCSEGFKDIKQPQRPKATQLLMLQWCFPQRDLSPVLNLPTTLHVTAFPAGNISSSSAGTKRNTVTWRVKPLNREYWGEWMKVRPVFHWERGEHTCSCLYCSTCGVQNGRQILYLAQMS